VKNHYLCSTLFLLIFFCGCKKKEKDTTSPVIHISSPVTSAAYNMFDTIPVSAHVSDETHLQSVVIALTDANNSVVDGSYPITIQGDNFNFDFKYILTEYHLVSGNYNISITANDGSHTTQRSVQVWINESPTIRTGYFIVGATQPKVIGNYDTSMALLGSINLATGFNGMAYGAYYRQLFINGHINQPLVGYDVTAGGNVWSWPYTGGSFPQCMSISTNGKKAFVGYYDGNVGTIDYMGTNSTWYASGNSGLSVYMVKPMSKYCLAAGYDLFANTNKLYAFYLNSGTAVNSVNTTFKIDAVYDRTDDEKYVLGNNSSNQAIIYLYNAATNGLVGPFTLPVGRLLSSAQVDPDNLLLAMDNGSIYIYRFSTGNYSSLASVKAQRLVYNAKMSELSAVVKNSVHTYSLSSNYTLIQTALKSVSDSIIGFEVITNK
jgi:hypothetical protein